MSESVELLSAPTNYAVVKLPGRSYPGVVFQGDSLNSLIRDLESLRVSAQGFGNEEFTFELQAIIDSLSQVRFAYEAVCDSKGISLPYSNAL